MCLQEVFGVDAESADCQSQISLEVCLLDQLNTRATGRSGGGAEHVLYHTAVGFRPCTSGDEYSS